MASGPASENPKAEAAPTDRFIREAGVAAEIAALAEPVLNDMGFRLVRVVISKREGGTVQIMADKAGGTINVDDCAAISRRLSPLLDAHDPIEGRYFLEVSSPGIDRILVRASDFEDWAGFEAKIELKEPLEGRRRFRGVLEGYGNGEARLRVTSEEGSKAQTMGFSLALIEEARLVLTDELIRASLSRAKTSGQKWSEGSEITEQDIKDSELNDGAGGH
ncbi:MAG TPA: ribosome maturation factor RimP [Hyphomicrobiales bacterium]|nr:ribosome maturation factor RimP [Hyphomicrobiales bacterium]